MLHLNRMFTIFLLLALILSACQPFQPIAPGQEVVPAPAASAPLLQPHQPRPDAPTYGVRGPYAVGVRDFVIEGKEGERPIPVSVWYPALNPDSRPEAVTYMLDFDNPDFPDFAVAGRALRDAAPNPSGGPYPLVVHSHGYWQFRQASVWLTEHLASYGFVVIAGDHEDNWGGLLGESESDNYVLRPQEISHQIDFAMTLDADDGALAGLIDAERVGVTGHSFGAETALLAGGARLNTNLLLNEWCAMYPGDPADVLNDCIAIPALLDKMVAMAGLDAAPEGLWPDWSDSRVDAVVSLASGAQYFGPEGLAALNVPVLLVESELDMFYGAATAYYQPYTLLPAGQKTHVVYERGNHMLFANNCEAMPGVVQQGLGWFCMDAVWDTSRAKDLANHFVTAFLLAELKGDAEAATALAAENVSFPGIQYETTGYGAVSEAAQQTALDDATVAKIEALVEETMARINLPGFALAVVKDGNLAYAKGFGVTSLDGGEPVTPQTVFQWAESSMSLTAMAVMQLVEEGKLALDAPVIDYVHYFKLTDERYQEITVGQLLAHTSGIPDSGDAMADWENFMPEYDGGALERWIRGDLAQKGLLFAPGTGWEYSDVAYALLGAVIGAASGQPYEAYMQEHIFTPLAMNKSTFLLEEVDKTLLASPHVPDAAGEVVVSAAIPYHRPFAATNNDSSEKRVTGMVKTREKIAGGVK